jgi:hypothetical protein
MVTVAIVTGTDADRTPDTQLPIALLATGEDYDNVRHAFALLAPEISEVKMNGFPYVLCLRVHAQLTPRVQ